jgi:hypothetical protein
MRCASSCERIAAAVGLRGPKTLSSLARLASEPTESVGLHVDVGCFLPVAQATPCIVHLYRAGLREVVPSTDAYSGSAATRNASILRHELETRPRC